MFVVCIACAVLPTYLRFLHACVYLKGTDIVERFWSRLGSWIMNKRVVRVKDALDVVGNMCFETEAKYGLGETERVGYVPRCKYWVGLCTSFRCM